MTAVLWGLTGDGFQGLSWGSSMWSPPLIPATATWCSKNAKWNPKGQVNLGLGISFPLHHIESAIQVMPTVTLWLTKQLAVPGIPSWLAYLGSMGWLSYRLDGFSSLGSTVVRDRTKWGYRAFWRLGSAFAWHCLHHMLLVKTNHRIRPYRDWENGLHLLRGRSRS